MDFVDYKAQYEQDLKDPRWKALVRKVRSYYHDTCQLCHQRKRYGLEMNVHHIRYYFNHKPWEYEKEDLILLCRKCHKKVHQILDIDKIARERYFYSKDLMGVGIADRVSANGIDFDVCWTEYDRYKVNGHGRIWFVGSLPIDAVRPAKKSEIMDFWEKVSNYYNEEEFLFYFGKYIGTLIIKCNRCNAGL